ncbi:heme oxygenase [Polymorphobacter glacialis]|uniref:Heme oxygenase n=1 Tax=Sandarakinorhabdus glacialis TaxID=1614636 RepID=A0A916ZJA8_9SPHN|nr:biliverdin-producing heme oxygenase [Polymorphobacter glacialis]GGE00682.1 heme oxygenase [Polymorphobacter glacialis]
MNDITDMLPTRAKRLKDATNETHDGLDKRIMSADPFGSRNRYGRLLRVQYCFHRDIDALYANPALDRLLPDLSARRRLAQIGRDIADLGQTAPAADRPPFFGASDVDLPTAFGWLYVAEGSNLGAAFLLKAAAALGLDADCGARHLAGHPGGRARHWREFTAALDALVLQPDEEDRVIAGARDAFVRVHTLVDAAFAGVFAVASSDAPS